MLAVKKVEKTSNHWVKKLPKPMTSPQNEEQNDTTHTFLAMWKFRGGEIRNFYKKI